MTNPNPTRHSSLVTRHRSLRDRAFTLVTLAAFALLILPPLIWLLAQALHSLTPSPPHPLIPRWRLLARSAAVAAGSAALAVGCGAPYGLLVARARVPARRLWAMLGVLPLLLPPY